MVAGPVGVGFIERILRVLFESHIIVNQAGLIGVDMPDSHIHHIAYQICAGQGVVQVTNLPIKDITIGVFTDFLENHIHKIISRPKHIVCAGFNHINRVFFVIGIQITDDERLANFSKVCRVGEPIHHGFCRSFTGQVAVPCTVI